MENDPKNCGYLVAEFPGIIEPLDFFKETRHCGRNLKPDQITIEDKPFVTLREGFPKSVTLSKLLIALTSHPRLVGGPAPTLTLGEVGFFPEEKTDALYVRVECEYFKTVHDRLIERLDGPSETVTYEPRLVFAHVQKGCGQFFEGISSFVNHELVIIYFRLNNNGADQRFYYGDIYRNYATQRLSSIRNSKLVVDI